MNTYIISYEFDTKANRDIWVAEAFDRHAYNKDGLFIGIAWDSLLSDEEFAQEADTIGNNADEYGRTGRRDVIKLYDEETIENALSRGLTETAIQYGIYSERNGS